MSWKNKVYRARGIGAICSAVEEKRGGGGGTTTTRSADEEDESGWLVQECKWMCGMVCGEGERWVGHAKSAGTGSEGDRLPPSQGRGAAEARRRGEASSLPAAEVISFEKARAFSPGSGFEEERWNERLRRWNDRMYHPMIYYRGCLRATISHPQPTPVHPRRLRLTAPNLPAFLAKSLSYLSPGAGGGGRGRGGGTGSENNRIV